MKNFVKYSLGVLIYLFIVFSFLGWDGYQTGRNYKIAGDLSVTGNITGNNTPVNIYIAYVNQSGTSAPTNTQIKNTFGSALTWTRTSAGVYAMNVGSSNTIVTFSLGTNSTAAAYKVAFDLTTNQDVILHTFTTAGAAVDLGTNSDFPCMIKVEDY